LNNPFLPLPVFFISWGYEGLPHYGAPIPPIEDRSGCERTHSPVSPMNGGRSRENVPQTDDDAASPSPRNRVFLSPEYEALIRPRTLAENGLRERGATRSSFEAGTGQEAVELGPNSLKECARIW